MRTLSRPVALLAVLVTASLASAAPSRPAPADTAAPACRWVCDDVGRCGWVCD